MSAWHLIWIVPLAAMIGFLTAALLAKVCQAVFDELTPITPWESDGIKESPSLAEISRVAAWVIGNTGAVAEKCQ